MERIKELKQVKDIRDNAVHQLLSMLPNYEVARLFTNDLDCAIEDALIVANDLIPEVDIYYKRNDRYYHVYKYSSLRCEYTAKVLYSREFTNAEGNVDTKWHSHIDHISSYGLDEAEAITKEEFEAKEALTE